MKGNYLKEELYDLINDDTSIFEFIQSGSLDGIWYWDLENPEYEWMSPKFWKTLGYNPHEKKHLSSEWQDIIFQDDLKLAIENFNKHCEDPNYPYDQIVRYRHRDGSTVWIRCRGLAIRDEDGKAIRMLGAHTDITDLKEVESEISRLTREYEKVFNGTQDAMFLINVLEGGGFKFIRNNLAHQNKTGILLEHIMNKTPEELLGEEMAKVVEKNYRECVKRKESITYEETLELPNGERIWLTTLTPIIEDGHISYIVGSSSDITERKKLEIQLEKYANYDKLTGLPNRRLFFDRLEEIIEESKRYGSEFSLLFVDLDGFKSINDNYGHEVGDQVLIRAGERLTENVRKSDIVARMGGDEFTIILRNISDREDLMKIVKKVHDKLRESMNIDEIECQVDSSIGIATYPTSGKDKEVLIKNADRAMYEIKKNGKGGFKFF